MPHRSALLVFSLLPLLLLVPPVQAQEADTTATDAPSDTTGADTTVADTVQTPPPDTSATETSAADTTATDTIQATAAADSLAADSLAADSLAADSLAADTVQSVEISPEEAKEQARAAATSWLSLTDAGKFGESWDAAASFLQNGISREVWQKRGRRARSQLNSLKSRDLMRIEYRDSTTQMSTEGPVVTFQYRSEFDADAVLEALITTQQEGEWKVAGYRIVPVPETFPNSDSTAIEPDSTAQQ